MAVDLSAMRKLFQEGGLKSALVVPVPMQLNAWELIAVCKDGSKEHMTIARSDRRKVYKSLESVHADAARVGFTQVITQVENLQVA
ncbi:plasmid replication protein RepB [Pseudomonas kitaguniensis]|uniref:plasmid replication protein RepB n=1 Tax=Pseudomonas kitaguniensis TaxID=2607908 RepID=UPI003BA0AD8F